AKPLPIPTITPATLIVTWNLPAELARLLSTNDLLRRKSEARNPMGNLRNSQFIGSALQSKRCVEHKPADNGAKRMECVRLAGAVGVRGACSSSKAPASRAHSIRFAKNPTSSLQIRSLQYTDSARFSSFSIGSGFRIYWGGKVFARR